MQKIDSVLLSVISDLLINLSAGWIGAVFIISPFLKFGKREKKFNILALTADLLFAILSLYIAFMLRKQI